MVLPSLSRRGYVDSAVRRARSPPSVLLELRELREERALIGSSITIASSTTRAALLSSLPSTDARKDRSCMSAYLARLAFDVF